MSLQEASVFLHPSLGKRGGPVWAAVVQCRPTSFTVTPYHQVLSEQLKQTAEEGGGLEVHATCQKGADLWDCLSGSILYILVVVLQYFVPASASGWSVFFWWYFAVLCTIFFVVLRRARYKSGGGRKTAGERQRAIYDGGARSTERAGGGGQATNAAEGRQLPSERRRA